MCPRLEKQYWFKCQCVACQENWPTMHEMTQDVLNFRSVVFILSFKIKIVWFVISFLLILNLCRCNLCGDSAPFHTSSNIPSLRCGCGTNINLFKGLKDLADTELLSEAASTELQKNNLEKAQAMYTDLLKKYDSIIAPPYPV